MVDDELVLENIREAVKGSDTATVYNKTKDLRYTVSTDFSDRQRAILQAGGCLNYIAAQE